MENYDGVSGVYLGPSRTLDEYDLEYLNGDITENDDIKDSYRLLNIFWFEKNDNIFYCFVTTSRIRYRPLLV